MSDANSLPIVRLSYHGQCCTLTRVPKRCLVQGANHYNSVVDPKNPPPFGDGKDVRSPVASFVHSLLIRAGCRPVQDQPAEAAARRREESAGRSRSAHAWQNEVCVGSRNFHVTRFPTNNSRAMTIRHQHNQSTLMRPKDLQAKLEMSDEELQTIWLANNGSSGPADERKCEAILAKCVLVSARNGVANLIARCLLQHLGKKKQRLLALNNRPAEAEAAIKLADEVADGAADYLRALQKHAQFKHGAIEFARFKPAFLLHILPEIVWELNK